MPYTGLIATFAIDVTEDEVSYAIQRLGMLPGVVSVTALESDPARLATIEQERTAIETRLRAVLPRTAPPDLLAAIIRAVRVDQGREDQG